MHRTAVINVVGLTRELLGPDTPNLLALAKRGAAASIRTVAPAVTCTVQSTFLTGLMPSQHGIVANGWYFRDLAQIWFWRQSNHLVQGEKLWETARARDPAVTCAKMFWWYNMYSSADFSVTPRPIYPADGRKIPEIYSYPPDLHAKLKATIGEFPFFSFWGPKADIKSSEWIAEASILVSRWSSPSLMLIYLPHLDYNLQRLGPKDPRIKDDLKAVDTICGKLIGEFEREGVRIIVLSEYGISEVDGPVHINRTLREAGLLKIRPELGLDMLDPGASEAFAVADHQVAHVYVKNRGNIAAVKSLLEKVPGIESVLDEAGKRAMGLDHERSGELVAFSRRDKWFTYYYWLDDARAPDFARTVDIHRKPGYDPAELFVDPKIRIPPVKVAWILAKKKLGFRYLMDVIPLDARLVKGSHGRIPDTLEGGPVLISSWKGALQSAAIGATEVKAVILDHLFQVPGT